MECPLHTGAWRAFPASKRGEVLSSRTKNVHTDPKLLLKQMTRYSSNVHQGTDETWCVSTTGAHLAAKRREG